MTLPHEKAGINYSQVRTYWNNATPSILGPYMMDGFGFPARAGNFRFNKEKDIVQQLIRDLNRSGTVLDLGCGIGYWSMYFAQSFRKVIAVESSKPLFDSLKQKCSPYSNIKVVQADVMTFAAEDRYNLIFLGGMLMYLNESDLKALLKKAISFLEPGGIILCRETTVRNGVITRQGEYQAVYRSVQTYEQIFRETGLEITELCRNKPYILMQMGCELIKKWKSIMPKTLQFIPFAGHVVYWGLRIGNSWIRKALAKMTIDFPELENHFFKLQTARNNQSDLNRKIA